MASFYAVHVCAVGVGLKLRQMSLNLIPFLLHELSAPYVGV